MSARPKICLSMIVRDEAKVIARCLESVKDVVDYYIVNDNGSTDGTPELIKKIMDGYGIKGEVFSSPWVNFGHNREEALQRAYKDGRWDYCLFIDADDFLCFKDGVKARAFDNLTADSYLVECQIENTVFQASSLISLKNEWHWKGVVHNYLSGNGTTGQIKGVWIQSTTGEGAKSHGLTSKEKFLRDANLLKEEASKNPKDTRSRFYLAQSYKDAGEYTVAIENYAMRVGMGGWDEEVYESLYQIARCKIIRGDPFPLDDFLAAYNYRPTRAEPLYQIARHYRDIGMRSIEYIFLKHAVSLPLPDDILYVNRSLYEWMLLDMLSLCCYWIGKYEESLELCERLLNSSIPDEQRARILENKGYAERKVRGEKGPDFYDQDAHSDVSRYNEIYQLVGELAQGKVLDIGCGVAGLRHHVVNYSGFDFSPESIKVANTDKVWVGNAYTENLDGYDTYIAIEVLEHLDDLALIKRLPKGNVFIFSVPSFTDPGHVRTYTEDSVVERFKGLLKIDYQVRFNTHGGKWSVKHDNTESYIVLCKAVVI